MRYLDVLPPYGNFYREGLQGLERYPDVHAVARNRAKVDPLFQYALRSDAIDVIYGTMTGFAALSAPYLPRHPGRLGERRGFQGTRRWCGYSRRVRCSYRRRWSGRLPCGREARSSGPLRDRPRGGTGMASLGPIVSSQLYSRRLRGPYVTTTGAQPIAVGFNSARGFGPTSWAAR